MSGLSLGAQCLFRVLQLFAQSAQSQQSQYISKKFFSQIVEEVVVTTSLFGFEISTKERQGYLKLERKDGADGNEVVQSALLANSQLGFIFAIFKGNHGFVTSEEG
jgi:hypothetical protein